MSEPILIDARGFRCPVPTLKLRKALESAGQGAQLRLLADDPMARIDVPHFLAQSGHQLAESVAEGSVVSFLIVKGA